MGDLVHGTTLLPISFWLELSLVVPFSLTVFLMVAAIKRAHQRHHYRAWRGAVGHSSRRAARR
jgi:hypothetical protein